MRQRANTLWLTLGCLGAVACGGSTAEPTESSTTPASEPTPPPKPAGPIHERGGQEVTAEVGTPGGTLELASGAKLRIPEGALAEPTDVTFGPGANTKVFQHREGTKPLGPILQVEPAMVAAPGTRFTVSIPFTAGLPSGFSQDDLALGVEMMDEQRAMQMGGTHTRWQNFPARVQAGELQGELEEMPGMRLQFLVSR